MILLQQLIIQIHQPQPEASTINKKNPNLIPNRIDWVWKPDAVASSIISLNQKKIQKLKHNNPNKKK